MRHQVTASLMACALALSMAVPTLAADTAVPTEGDPAAAEEQAVAQSVLYYGQVTAILTDETGAVTQLALSSDRYGEYIMNVSAETLWVDAGRQSAADSRDLSVGEGLYIYHSPVSTRSLPPQSAAYVVIRNVPEDSSAPHFHTVEEVIAQEDGSVQILVDGGGLYISADGETGLSHYQSDDASQLSDLQVGDRVLAWYDIVLTSYPGQTYARYLMFLPEEGWEAPTSDPAEHSDSQLPEEVVQLPLTLDGEASALTGRYENGVAMVPVAAVAQTLGFDVTYTRNEDGSALVTVESDSFQVQLNIGQRQIIGVTKIPGAVGMTAPTDYGAAPYIVEPGTTWAPAQLFEMLGKTVTLDETGLAIQ